MAREPANSVPLSPEDLSFWYADQPRQRTTMAMLMLLDRRPDPERLRAAAARAVDAVPRLRQRVVDAAFGNVQAFTSDGRLLLPFGRLSREDVPGGFAREAKAFTQTCRLSSWRASGLRGRRRHP